MIYKTIVMPQAQADITEAYRYIAERAPDAAARWVKLIRVAVESLSEMPARCARAPESPKLGVELRQLLYGKRPGVYRIIFRIVETSREVHILTVRHGARKPLTDEEIAPFLELDQTE